MSEERIEWGTDTGWGNVTVWSSEERARRAALLIQGHTVVSRYVIEGDWEPA